MKKTQEIKIIITSILFFVSILAITLGILFYLNNYSDKREKKLKWLKSDISSTEKEISDIGARSKYFHNSEKIWSSIPDDKKLFKGLRISEAKAFVDNLKNKYNLSTLEFSFSKPIIIDESSSSDLKAESVVVNKSQIDIKISALTDISIINFYIDLVDNFPGFLQTTSFSLENQSKPTKLQLIEISNGQLPSFISSRISLVWHDFRVKEKKLENKEVTSK